MSFGPNGVTYGPGVVQLEGVVEYAGDPAPRVIAARVREFALAADTTDAVVVPPVGGDSMITEGGNNMITEGGDQIVTEG
jgi:hypothetical protein